MTNAPAKLRLVDGKFYRGKDEVKPTFGDTEQIKLIKKLEDNAEMLRGDGLCVQPDTEEITTIEVDVQFMCLCGRSIHYTDTLEVDWRGQADEYLDFTRSCSCGKQYKGIYDKMDCEYVIKLVE